MLKEFINIGIHGKSIKCKLCYACTEYSGFCLIICRFIHTRTRDITTGSGRSRENGQGISTGCTGASRGCHSDMECYYVIHLTEGKNHITEVKPKIWSSSDFFPKG